MKHDIIKTDDYLLAVGKDRKRGWFYCVRTKSFFHDEGEDVLCCNGDLPIDAHLPLNGSPILKGVDLLPPLEEDEVEKLAKKYTEETQSSRMKRVWKAGYNKAKEKYKYTEEDLRKAIQLAWEADSIDGTVDLNIVLHYGDNDDLRTKWSEYEIIQSLSQPKAPIGFECEMLDTGKLGFTSTVPMNLTTTTPEGHTQWIGTYIYE